MSMKLIITTLILIVALLLVLPVSALAVPSQDFHEEDGQVFDDWNICRTQATGQNGFFQISETGFQPIIALESLGQNIDKAYQIGQELARDYPDSYQRAEMIFAFARDKIRYTSDADLFGFPEFAQNADELVATIEEDGIAYGDCEDYAVLLAVMYKGAGYRSAIILTPDHAATLVHLPGYKKANQNLSLNGESGWVWAEATGKNNPLGWMPERYMGAKLVASEVSDEAMTVLEPPQKPSTTVTPERTSPVIQISPFFGIIGLLWLLSAFRRRR